MASDVKQILAIPGLPVAIDPAAIHKCPTFSFVPGKETPIRAIHRLLSRRIARWEDGRLASGSIPVLPDMVWKLDLPFGDPLTESNCCSVGQRTNAGLAAISNGEGGDELFGGWTSKPILSAQLAANLHRRLRPPVRVRASRR